MNNKIQIKQKTNSSPWSNDYVVIEFDKNKLQPIVDKLAKECNGKSFSSSYQYNSIVESVLKQNIDNTIKNKNPIYKALFKMLEEQKPKAAAWHNGHAAAIRVLDSIIAYSTPGFIEAKIYHDIYG